MRISTKGRYALRLMIDIAINSEDGETVSIKDIAERQEISTKYLEQIISILNKSGLVKSVRGPHGGYLLTNKPEKYTVGMILRVTEGDLSPVPCLEDDVNKCNRSDNCATLLLWIKLSEAVSSVIDNVTLADLVEWMKSGESISENLED